MKNIIEKTQEFIANEENKVSEEFQREFEVLTQKKSQEILDALSFYPTTLLSKSKISRRVIAMLKDVRGRNPGFFEKNESPELDLPYIG